MFFFSLSYSLLQSLACRWQATQKRKWWIEIKEKQEEERGEKIKNSMMFSLCSSSSSSSFLFIFFSFFLSRLLISRHECIDLCVALGLSAIHFTFYFWYLFIFSFFLSGWQPLSPMHKSGFFFFFLQFLGYLRWRLHGVTLFFFFFFQIFILLEVGLIKVRKWLSFLTRLRFKL